MPLSIRASDCVPLSPFRAAASADAAGRKGEAPGGRRIKTVYGAEKERNWPGCGSNEEQIQHCVKIADPLLPLCALGFSFQTCTASLDFQTQNPPIIAYNTKILELLELLETPETEAILCLKRIERSFATFEKLSEVLS